MSERIYPETRPETPGKSVKKTASGKEGGVGSGRYLNVKDQQLQEGYPPFLDRPQPQSAGPVPPATYFDDGGYNGRPRRKRRTCCLCVVWSCVALALVIFLLGLAALIFWLVVRPKIPKYNVSDVRVSSFSVALTPTNDFVLNAVTTFQVEARNPNKKIGIYYDVVDIDAYSEGAAIGHGNVPRFYQGHKNTTLFTGQLQGSNIPLASTVGTALQNARSTGRIPLSVAVDVKARIKIGKWKSPHFWVHVRCTVEVNPDVSSGSQVIRNTKKCHVKR